MPSNDKSHTATTIRDAQREMIDANDMIDNRGQVKRLMDAGYKGCVSFEPFAPSFPRSRE